jgi:PKD repeat protein
MTLIRNYLVTALLALALQAAGASAQYIYLDANGDGVNTAEDALDQAGVTTLDIWLVTDAGRDGTPAACSEDPGASFDVWSYEVILRAVGGTVEWGPMANRLPINAAYGPVNFAEGYQDTTNATEYHNGWGSRYVFPPGRHLLATLPVRIASGQPAVVFAPSMSINGHALTSFGSNCPGAEWDFTRKLGTHWFDAGGIGPVVAEAGGPYSGVATRAVTFTAAGSLSPHGEALRYTWDFGDGSTGSGMTVSHAYHGPGTYTATLTASDGSRSGTDEAVVRIAPFEQSAPVSVAGGPYSGTTARAIQFDGGASFDPNGDPLQYRWDFGDGSTTTAVRPRHLYGAAGTYDVELIVFDGALSGSDRTVARVEAVASNAPIPAPGGPYTGYVGRGVRFDGSRTIDPDGDYLTFQWAFGDRTSGFGMYGHHAYEAPGIYRVLLTVKDEVNTATAGTSATILDRVPCRAFMTPGNRVFDLLGSRSTLEIQVEPVQESFAPEEADLDWIELHSPGTGSASEILALGTMSYAGEDTDGNGMKEVTAVFHRDDLTRLFDAVTRSGVVPAEILVSLGRGGRTLGRVDIEVRAADPVLVARVHPNPFNPEGSIRFETSRAGRVRLEVFDLQGRLVRVLLDETAAQPRRYTVRIGSDLPLASGIYFYRISAAQGVTRGRFAVAR